MERADHKCMWSCENDRWCRAVYRYRWKETPAGDARQVRPDEIPDFDLLCAGFPCQSFSTAGKRQGFRDPRGTLFYEICRIARAKRPRLLLLENVAGLLSVNRGETFGAVLQELGDLGYGVEWQVLNSKGFGVPQNRRRVFIVGHLGGLGGQEVFPITEVGGDGDERDKETAGGQIANTLSGESAGGQNARGNYVIYDDYNKRLRGDNLCGTVRPTFGRRAAGNAYKIVVPIPIRFLNRNQRNFDPDTAMTVDTVCSTGVTDGIRIRCHTPRECERLQGFPDDFTKYGINEKGIKVEISDHHRYDMIGNAVTVNVVEFIARRLPA